MKKKILDETELLVEKIIEGIQEKKGMKITKVDMSGIENYVFRNFVICEGKSNTQVNSIADSVKDYVREELQVKPYFVDGYTNAEWIAMDYGQVVVHIFQPEARRFYNLEELWEDAKLEQVPDLA